MPYTAGDVLVQAIMTSDSGLPEDRFVNNFAFRKAGMTTPTNAELLSLFAAVDGFYNDTQSTGSKVASYISEAVSRAATHELAAYQIQAGDLGSPILTDPWLGPDTSIASDNLPTEVAAVLSFHADLTGIAEEAGVQRPRARRRGRIYVGPLTQLALTSDPSPKLADGLRNVLQAAAVKLFDDATAAGFSWRVWSRQASELYAIVGGWTDNAPDTQRRRGPKATSRSTFTTV